MTQREITIARIYVLEADEQLDQILDILANQHIVGVTVVRAIEGMGDSGDIHTSSLLSLSLELPLIIEFYDVSDKIFQAINALQSQLDLKHIVSWPATVHIQ